MAVSNLRCLVVDDDPLSVQIVLNCINNTPFLTAVGSFTNPVEAAEALRTAPVDLLFLDVEMPLLSGIELLGMLQNPPLVVLITSSKDYAVQAFEHAVVDYLVKPVSYARFLQASQKALEMAGRRATTAGPDGIEASDADADFTFVKVDNKLVRVGFDEVRYVEALGDYVHIVTGQSKLIVYSTMKAVEEKFPSSRFVRVHRSFIVNFNRIQALEDNSVIVEGKHIPVGQTYLREVMQRLNKF
ncbi:LytR/AlgR family response regulator transcription factor [Hymenobacter negativus]|uniref:Response regulator transcription factor n=1 Tax=Hymenobacter negativus TaxID=2795026 RepID=A0ABS0QAP5_9BACT|nr:MULTISPECIES: LytTR family DNA-binding domain-containing protein [Bacteria]MBH8559645.1 response regulator transcription factor [Hymenobacter negativus]MBH8570760.1 response regulator transcription factor [Hymenobacter negativus]MBR7210497.1 response regulator transcription factor [Microvirga sp. STS02]